MNSVGNTSFDPENLILLRAALAEAWSSLRPEQQELTSKSVVGQTILHLAAQGERDPVRLCTHALLARLNDEHFQISKNDGRCMSVFTFEIVRQGETPVIADVLWLSDERAVWCHAEALALRIQNGDDAFIRVKNSGGETVVRAGVPAALATIEKCSWADCPLKRKLKRRASAGAPRPILVFRCKSP